MDPELKERIDAHIRRSETFRDQATGSLQAAEDETPSLPEDLNWAAVQFFYSVVHAAEAALLRVDPEWASRHSDRKSNSERKRKIRDRFFESRADLGRKYNHLYGLAEDARYEADKIVTLVELKDAKQPAMAVAGYLIGQALK